MAKNTSRRGRPVLKLISCRDDEKSTNGAPYKVFHVDGEEERVGTSARAAASDGSGSGVPRHSRRRSRTNASLIPVDQVTQLPRARLPHAQRAVENHCQSHAAAQRALAATSGIRTHAAETTRT